MDQSVSNFPEMKVRGVMQHSQTQYMRIYIYIWYPPLESLPFSWAKGGTIYIYYISMFWKFRFCFGRRGV